MKKFKIIYTDSECFFGTEIITAKTKFKAIGTFKNKHNTLKIELIYRIW